MLDGSFLACFHLLKVQILRLMKQEFAQHPIIYLLDSLTSLSILSTPLPFTI